MERIEDTSLKKHVLVVDDDASVRTVLEAELTERDWRVSLSQDVDGALALLGTKDVSVVLTDFQMLGGSGADLCERLGASGSDVPVVVMTSFGSLDTAVAAIRAGAHDYVTKPLDANDLAITLNRAVNERALREEATLLRHAVEATDRFERMTGTSPSMAKVYDLVARVAASEATVLVTGESGTGKELAAKALHARSPRAAEPFVAINCAAMPESLLESELFGHVKGAFTDARQTRRGLFLKAEGGTLFLDEIGEMPAGMQAKLLRTLQERTVRPVGGDEEIPFDTRIVAATNRDLEQEVTEKRFREDLFYRINVVRVDLPPLRARGRDVLELAHDHLVRCQTNGRRILGFTPQVIDALLTYPWPGNVRELQNCIECAVALAEFDHLRVDDLPEKVTRPLAAPLGIENDGPTGLITAAELEQRYIAYILGITKGDAKRAAQILGCDPRTVRKRRATGRGAKGRDVPDAPAVLAGAPVVNP